jgi:hypothetical protein
MSYNPEDGWGTDPEGDIIINDLMTASDKKNRMEILDSMFNAYNSKRYDAMVNHFSELYIPLEEFKRILLDLQKEGKYMEVSDEVFADMCEKITSTSEYLYFLLDDTGMKRLGIDFGGSERQVAEAIFGEEDGLYSEDLIKDFYALDLNVLFLKEIPYLKDATSRGMAVEWDVASGCAVDIWYGLFAEHSGVQAIATIIEGKENVQKSEEKFFQNQEVTENSECNNIKRNQP